MNPKLESGLFLSSPPLIFLLSDWDPPIGAANTCQAMPSWPIPGQASFAAPVYVRVFQSSHVHLVECPWKELQCPLLGTGLPEPLQPPQHKGQYTKHIMFRKKGQGADSQSCYWKISVK